MATSKSALDIKDTLQTTITNFDDKLAQFRILWTISDYESIKIALKRNECIESTKSFSVFDNDQRYRLKLRPKNTTHVDLILHQIHSQDAKLWINCRVKIVDKNFYIQHGGETSHISEVGNDGNILPDLFPIDLSQDLLPNKCLQILFEGTMWAQEDYFVEKHIFNSLKKGSSVLADPRFFTCYDPALHDSRVTVNNGNSYLPVSKSFLNSRSSVFQKKFSSVSDDNIIIPNVGMEVFKIILYFLHTNTVPATISTMLPEVIKFASEFELSYLLEICQIKMIENLDVENAVDYFRVANEINAKSLKDKCRDFIIANGNAISQQQSFQNFKSENRDLGELLERLMIGSRPVVNF